MKKEDVKADHSTTKSHGFYAVIDGGYGRMLEWALRHRAAMLGMAREPRDADRSDTMANAPLGTALDGERSEQRIAARLTKDADDRKGLPIEGHQHLGCRALDDLTSRELEPPSQERLNSKGPQEIFGEPEIRRPRIDHALHLSGLAGPGIGDSDSLSKNTHFDSDVMEIRSPRQLEPGNVTDLAAHVISHRVDPGCVNLYIVGPGLPTIGPRAMNLVA